MKKELKENMELLRRGTVELFTEKGLSEKLTESSRTKRQLRVKLGLDPTSADIHLGHTVVLRKVRQFQDLGHKAVLIIGDYTARIGDPSGQDCTRPMLGPEEIRQNAKTYFEQAGKILTTSEEQLEVRYNSEWLSELRLADILKLAANCTVARMLERDTFEIRYKKGDPIGIHEFLYPLMQGYDSVIVKSDVELGGTDQTFNNLIGRDLQRIHGQSPQIVITMPILVGLDGKEKMSKSKGNYIGVTDDPNDMYGKIMSISDDMMENYFTLLTGVEQSKIAELINPEKTHPKEAKSFLAKNIVSQFYNESAAEKAGEQFEQVFSKGKLPDDIPEVRLKAGPMQANKLLLACGLVSSGGQGKRMIKQSAVQIDGNKVNNPNDQITPKNGMVIQVGKRKFAKVTIIS